MLQNGMATLGSLLQNHAGRTVTLTQGGTVITDLQAPVSMEEHDVVDDEGFLTKAASIDWTIVVADLDGLELRAGAIISERVGCVTKNYEAMPLGRDRPCVEPKDNSGVMIILHTKEVS